MASDTMHRVSGRPSGRMLLLSLKLPVAVSVVDGRVVARSHMHADAALMDQRVQALRPLVGADQGVFWVGALPTSSDVPLDAATMDRIREDLRPSGMIPVFLPEMDRDLHYRGFCRTFLWPVLHAETPSTELLMAAHALGGERFHEADMFDAYKRVCQALADAALEFLGVPSAAGDGKMDVAEPPQDVILVNGYELMLCPGMLRKVSPQAVIGLFWHTPFPTSELFRVVARRSELLQGMLGADVIGFHTHSYIRHFLSSCARILGLVGAPTHLTFRDRRITLLASPLGIHIPSHEQLLSSGLVQQRVASLNQLYKDTSIIISVDSLDASKGITKKMLAFDEMLQAHPELVGSVALIQVTTPATASLFSRAPDSLLQQVQETVGRLNGRYAKISGDAVHVGGPIYHLASTLTPHDLAALMASADVYMSTALRDGMNMDPVSYTVARVAVDKPACIVITEFAGCASVLKNGVWTVNPHDPKATGSALYAALTAPDDVKAGMTATLMTTIRARLTSFTWFATLANSLAQHVELRQEARNLPCGQLDAGAAARELREHSGHAMLVIDIDPFLSGERLGSSNVMAHLTAAAAALPKCTLVALSAKSRSEVDTCMGDAPQIVRLAEAGASVRWDAMFAWESTGAALVDERVPDCAWQEQVAPVLQYFMERTPGTSLRRTVDTVEWCFGGAANEYTSQQIRDAVATLMDLTASLQLHIGLHDDLLVVAKRTQRASLGVLAMCARLQSASHRPLRPRLHTAAIASQVAAAGVNASSSEAAKQEVATRLAAAASRALDRLCGRGPVTLVTALLGQCSSETWNAVEDAYVVGARVEGDIATPSPSALARVPSAVRMLDATHRQQSSMFSFIDLSRLLEVTPSPEKASGGPEAAVVDDPSGTAAASTARPIAAFVEPSSTESLPSASSDPHEGKPAPAAISSNAADGEFVHIRKHNSEGVEGLADTLQALASQRGPHAAGLDPRRLRTRTYDRFGMMSELEKMEPTEDEVRADAPTASVQEAAKPVDTLPAAPFEKPAREVAHGVQSSGQPPQEALEQLTLWTAPKVVTCAVAASQTTSSSSRLGADFLVSDADTYLEVVRVLATASA